MEYRTSIKPSDKGVNKFDLYVNDKPVLVGVHMDYASDVEFFLHNPQCESRVGQSQAKVAARELIPLINW